MTKNHTLNDQKSNKMHEKHFPERLNCSICWLPQFSFKNFAGHNFNRLQILSNLLDITMASCSYKMDLLTFQCRFVSRKVHNILRFWSINTSKYDYWHGKRPLGFPKLKLFYLTNEKYDTDTKLYMMAGFHIKL